MSTKPSLETCAGLYAAAFEIKDAEQRQRAVIRTLTSAKLHGYSYGQIRRQLRAPQSARATDAAPSAT